MNAIATFGHYPTGAGTFGAIPPGVSVDAQSICRKLLDVGQYWIASASGQSRYGEPMLALFELYERCRESDWDGEGADPISIEALLEANKLLSSLPSSMPTPEFLPEASGSIAFEWYRGRNKVYVISVSGTKTIEYAGLFGYGNETHGKVNFEDSMPLMIRNHLLQFFLA